MRIQEGLGPQSDRGRVSLITRHTVSQKMGS
jgi:hypothetical protein